MCIVQVKDPLFKNWNDLCMIEKKEDAVSKLREYSKHDNVRIVKIYAEYKKELKLYIQEEE